MTAARTLVIAHRGASAGEVDNSLEAFAKAIEVGSDVIEFDVRRTRDDQVIAFHDPDVNGTPLERLSRADIATALGYEPPLLNDILDLTRGKIRLDIEFKEAGYTAEVLESVSKHFEPEHVIVTSFIDSVVSEAKRLLPGVKVGLLTGLDKPRRLLRTRLSELFPVHRARACGADYVAMHFKLAEMGALGRAHAAGFPAFIWTVNDDERLRRYLSDDRVEAVITDVPARALELRG